MWGWSGWEMTRCGRGADIFVTSLPVFETSNLKLRWAGESSIDFPGGKGSEGGSCSIRRKHLWISKPAMVQETSIELLPALPGTGNSSLAIVATFRATGHKWSSYGRDDKTTQYRCDNLLKRRVAADLHPRAGTGIIGWARAAVMNQHSRVWWLE